MTTREFNDRLAKRARKVGLSLPATLVESLSTFYRLLEFWNQKVNLTAFPLSEMPDEAIDRLLVEPLLAARHLHGAHPGHSHSHATPRLKLLDIGSGGGSPAIPLKLAAPSLSLLMVESKTRKSAFLREAIRQLGLADAAVETARAEDLLTRSELHESQDIVTIRAVRIEPRLLTSIQAFLKTRGRIMLFKTASQHETPPLVAPPLVYEATFTLIETLRSRLVVLRKML